jgi:Na+/proline symporter
MIMVSGAVLMSVVPGALFGVIWRRMSRAKEKGRGRVLGIFFGFLFLLLSSPVEILSATMPDPVLFVSSPIAVFGLFIAFLGSLIFYLGVSGRLDKWYYDRRR